jgi:hypothetical protein
MAGEKIVVLALTIWLVIAPVALLAIAVFHERRAAQRRYVPPRPGPGDDWGGTHVHRLGWWNEWDETTRRAGPPVDAG